jgi:small subunit ribosomal protein S19e
MNYNEVHPQKLLTLVSAELQKKKECTPPVWSSFVKTGQAKTQPPQDPLWWTMRVAAILRTVAKNGPIGTNSLKIKYGGKKRIGHRKPQYRTGSGKIARVALQQLQQAGLVEHKTVSTHKGRVVTQAGLKLLNDCASKVK